MLVNIEPLKILFKKDALHSQESQGSQEIMLHGMPMFSSLMVQKRGNMKCCFTDIDMHSEVMTM